MRSVVMNASRCALLLAAALLALWATPGAAQPSESSPATASKKLKKSTSAKKPSARKGTRGKKPAAPEDTAAEPPPEKQPSEATLLDPPAAAASDKPVLPAAAPSPALAAPTTSAPPTAPTSSAPEAERPWAKGVSKQDQEKALELFRQGNALLKENIFAQAAEKYRQALALWSHPAIHYNLALVLMNLDQPLEVHEHLEEALRYGSLPLEAEKFEYAKHYKTLVEQQLSRVEVACDKPGALVTVDGKAVFTAPGHYSTLVRPGAHTVVASLQGYLPNNQSRNLLPGQTATFELPLFTSEELTHYRRKLPAALPWVVMGAGAALAGGSALLHLQARDDFRAFDTGITDCGGCVPQGALAAQRSQGTLMQNVAIGGYAVGGAALITGAVLAFINQPQAYRVEPGQLSLEHVSLSPLLGGGSGGVQASLRF